MHRRCFAAMFKGLLSGLAAIGATSRQMEGVMTCASLAPADWPAFEQTHTQSVRECDTLTGLR